MSTSEPKIAPRTDGGETRPRTGASPGTATRHEQPTLAHIIRALAIDPRVAEMRCDLRAHFLDYMRGVLTRADRDTLETRPTRAWLATFTGRSERSITNYGRIAEALGYVTITEEGTTARIRAGRCYPEPDPHAGDGNRAQVYQLHIPAPLKAAVLAPYDDQEQARQTRVPAGSRRTCAPSLGTCSTQGKNPSTPVGTTPTRARARGSNTTHRPTVKTEKKEISPRNNNHGRGLWRGQLDAVRAVWAALPAELTAELGAHEAPRIADAIALELTHRTPDQLAERITRHWAYWRFKLAAGLVRSPAAIAFRLVRRDFDCPDVRCEDRHQIDLDAPCKACALKAEEIMRERRGGQPAPVRRPTREQIRQRNAAAAARVHAVPPPGPRPDRCDPNSEFRSAREALKRQLGAAALRSRGRAVVA